MSNSKPLLLSTSSPVLTHHSADLGPERQPFGRTGPEDARLEEGSSQPSISEETCSPQAYVTKTTVRREIAVRRPVADRLRLCVPRLFRFLPKPRLDALSYSDCSGDSGFGLSDVIRHFLDFLCRRYDRSSQMAFYGRHFVHGCIQ